MSSGPCSPFSPSHIALKVQHQPKQLYTQHDEFRNMGGTPWIYNSRDAARRCFEADGIFKYGTIFSRASRTKDERIDEGSQTEQC
jgi:hypothetical protein